MMCLTSQRFELRKTNMNAKVFYTKELKVAKPWCSFLSVWYGYTTLPTTENIS